MPDTRVEIKGSMLMGALDMDFTKELDQAAEYIINVGLVDRIAERKNLEGGAQKSNEPSTKARKGHDHPLVDKGLLASPKTYGKRVGKRKVTVFVKARTVRRGKKRDTPRSRVVAHLEDKGYEYFGVSAEDEETIVAGLEKSMLERVRKAVGL